MLADIRYVDIRTNNNWDLFITFHKFKDCSICILIVLKMSRKINNIFYFWCQYKQYLLLWIIIILIMKFSCVWWYLFKMLKLRMCDFLLLKWMLNFDPKKKHVIFIRSFWLVRPHRLIITVKFFKLFSILRTISSFFGFWCMWT